MARENGIPILTDSSPQQMNQPVVCRVYMSPIALSSSSTSSPSSSRQGNKGFTGYKLQRTAFPPKSRSPTFERQQNFVHHVKKDFDELTARVRQISKELGKYEKAREAYSNAKDHTDYVFTTSKRNASFRLPDIVISDADASRACSRLKQHFHTEDLSDDFTPFRYSTPSFLQISKPKALQTRQDSRVTKSDDLYLKGHRSRSMSSDPVSETSSLKDTRPASEPPRTFLLSPTRANIRPISQEPSESQNSYHQVGINSNNTNSSSKNNYGNKSNDVYTARAAFPSVSHAGNQSHMTSKEGSHNMNLSTSLPNGLRPVNIDTNTTGVKFAFAETNNYRNFMNSMLASSFAKPCKHGGHIEKSRRLQEHGGHGERSKRLQETKDRGMKVSLPCQDRSCYCVYATVLGPVKVYFRQTENAKKEQFLSGIRDGNGKLAIPVSRKCDVRGLVYDRQTHSFHPPAKGQRPMFKDVPHHQSYRQRPLFKDVPHHHSYGQRQMFKGVQHHHSYSGGGGGRSWKSGSIQTKRK